jgi:hypothetical protein
MKAMLLTHDLTREQLERVEVIVREDLAEGFRDLFVFDPIWVIPYVSDAFPDDPMDFLRILIVFEGDQKNLDASWTVGMIDRMLTKLEAAGIPHFPSSSFIGKREWERYARKRWEKYLPENRR